MIRATQFLHDLTDLDDATRAGSKAYNLGRVEKSGIRTPGGVAVPDTVFQEHLKRAALTADVRRLHAGLQTLGQAEIDTLSADIRRAISETALQSGLLRALQRKYESSWKDRPLAVRSSAVGEDSAATSFAGQLDSYLGIDSTTALESAIKSTWSSLFSLRVLLYSRHKRVTSQHMGVIVQPQVDARLSGVLFTRDPTGRNSDSMVLEYAEGLGGQLVSGAITPSRFRIGRSAPVLIADFIAPDSPDLGPETRAALIELASISLRLESAFGGAQDIEWCIDDSNRLFIVQSRPATQCRNLEVRRPEHWSNANIAENFPEPVSPFLYSIVRAGYSAYFRNLALGFGLSRRRVAAMSRAFDNIVGLQGGRLYYNLSNIHSLLLMMPRGQRLVEFFNLFVGAERIPPAPALRLNRWSKALEAVRIAASVVWQYLFIHPRIRRFEERVDEFANRTHPGKLSGKNATALAEDVSAFLEIRLRHWNDAALADTAAMVCYGALKSRLTHWLKIADHTALHNDLLKGLPGLASSLPVTHLWALSRRIEKDDALKALFADNSPDEILRRIGEPGFADFAKAFGDFLDQWGFRSSAELMLTKPTPVEDPRPLLDLLAAYVRSGASSPELRTAEQMRKRLATTSRVAADISPLTGWRFVPLLSAASRFRILLASTQGAIRLRERARMKQALLYTRLRHIVLQLGERLVQRGVLLARDDIFLLPVEQVLDIVARGATDNHELSVHIDAQREAMRIAGLLQPPDRMVLAEGASWQPSAPVTASDGAFPDVLRGTGACGGSVSGDAAVVVDVAQAGRVKAGQILVTRQTDPGWATVFFLVHGLVIERGGMLSHGAIIAREYGIPAVVGVAGATSAISDGDRLRVDGDQGLVEFTHC